MRAIVLALLTLAASVLCFPTPARNIGVAALAGLAAAIVGYDGLYSSIVNSLDYGDIHWLTWSVGMLVLLGAAICASIWIARTGLSVRGARTGVLLGASGGALLLSVAALWNPIGVGSVFTYSTVDGAANALIRAIVWIGVVILAAAAADRRTRLWAIGAFAAFWLVTGWEWFADHTQYRYTQYRYSNNPSITIAGWVTLVVVAGIVALIVATNKIGGTPNPKSSTHQFPA